MLVHQCQISIRQVNKPIATQTKYDKCNPYNRVQKSKNVEAKRQRENRRANHNLVQDIVFRFNFLIGWFSI